MKFYVFLNFAIFGILEKISPVRKRWHSWARIPRIFFGGWFHKCNPNPTHGRATVFFGGARGWGGWVVGGYSK